MKLVVKNDGEENNNSSLGGTMLVNNSNTAVAEETKTTQDSYGVSLFIWKSVGAALCGASIPAVVFYYLF